ncbi:ankyrin, partial [Lophium mytilinum]
MKEAIAGIRKSDLEALKTLIQRDPAITTQYDSDSKYLLHYAAEVGQSDFVRHILEIVRSLDLAHGLSGVLNAQTMKGSTPMMLAAEQGNQEVVECLLREGARLDIASRDGKNVLDYASHAGYTTIADLLIRNGAQVNDSRTF